MPVIVLTLTSCKRVQIENNIVVDSLEVSNGTMYDTKILFYDINDKIVCHMAIGDIPVGGKSEQIFIPLKNIEYFRCEYNYYPIDVDSSLILLSKDRQKINYIKKSTYIIDEKTILYYETDKY